MLHKSSVLALYMHYTCLVLAPLAQLFISELHLD